MDTRQRRNPQGTLVTDTPAGGVRYPRRSGALRRAVLAGVLLLAVVCLVAAPADGSHQRAGAGRARLARTLSATDTAKLHIVNKGGEELTEEGVAKGTLPGKVRAYLNIGPTVVTRFTIYTRRGSITGQGSGRPKGRAAEPSFAGTMTVSHGTGLYKHAHGHGGFYGVLNRTTYALTVQTTGTLAY